MRAHSGHVKCSACTRCTLPACTAAFAFVFLVFCSPQHSDLWPLRKATAQSRSAHCAMKRQRALVTLSCSWQLSLVWKMAKPPRKLVHALSRQASNEVKGLRVMWPQAPPCWQASSNRINRTAFSAPPCAECTKWANKRNRIQWSIRVVLMLNARVTTLNLKSMAEWMGITLQRRRSLPSHGSFLLFQRFCFSIGYAESGVGVLRRSKIASWLWGDGC